MSTVKGHDVTHSCTVGGGMHLQVVCNPPFNQEKKKNPRVQQQVSVYVSREEHVLRVTRR